MSLSLKPLLFVAAVGLAGCVSIPTGPSVMVLPGTGRTFDEFRFDEGACRQYAYDSIGGQTATQAQQNSGVASAVVGTAVGAAAGAAISGSSGAAAGAGVGLLAGSLIGASTANASGYEAQYRYDMAYTQCMYSKGHKVPSSGRFSQPARTTYSPPPPPPPGTPPPPPRSSW